MREVTGSTSYLMMAGIKPLRRDVMEIYRAKTLTAELPFFYRMFLQHFGSAGPELLKIFFVVMFLSALWLFALSVENNTVWYMRILYFSGCLLCETGFILAAVHCKVGKLRNWEWLSEYAYEDKFGEMPAKAYELKKAITKQITNADMEAVFRVHVIGDDPILNFRLQQKKTGQVIGPEYDLLVWDKHKQVVDPHQV